MGQCFLEPAKYFGQIYALVRPLEVKGASADGLFLLRNKRLVEAIRGQIRFWANVFWIRPSILVRAPMDFFVEKQNIGGGH